MARIWEYDSRYAFCRRYVDFCTRTGFSKVSVEGLETVPRDGAVILAPNHCCALIDALLILLLEKGSVAFGARSDIFAKPAAAKALRFLRILPIARERNGLSEVARNLEVFDEIVDCLDHGVPFCLFSEGTHRPERGMQPVKKGIFRIARLACGKLPGKVYVVPVGLDYEYFFHGAGRVCIRIGQAIECRDRFGREEPGHEAETYRELCEELRNRVLGLIGRLPERSRAFLPIRILLALLSLPVFVACGVLSFPIWVPYLILLARTRDKAWALTIRYALRFVMPLLLPFHIAVERLLGLYRNVLEDLKRK